VENAVKHGVSSLQERGRIDISFVQRNSDLLVYITDNGNGFDTRHIHYGYGLQLTKRRITFANEISGTQAIFMEIHSNKGTSVTITYQKWLI
jgi:LytS/YehU family sensor histidine kinase